VLGVVRRHVFRILRADVLPLDRVHLPHVERAVVGEVEPALPVAPFVPVELGGDLEDGGEVGQLLPAAVPAADLPPPDVGCVVGAARPLGGLEQDAEVGGHGVGDRGIPDVYEVALGRHGEKTCNRAPLGTPSVAVSWAGQHGV
jgi:hypothetical protein